MTRLWRVLVERLAHREPGTPLALFRIAVGLVLGLSLLDLVLSGAAPLVLLDAADGGMVTLQPSNLQWRWLGLAHTPATVWSLLAGSLGLSVLLVVGLGGRLTALVLLQVCLLLFAINPGAGGGHDKLLTNALWLLVLSPATQTLSLDCRLRSGSWWSVTPVVAWPRYLAVVQLSLVYASTGLQKLGSSWHPWGDWSAVYHSLLLPSWSRWNLEGWLGWLYPFTQLATALTWAWECSFPVVLVCLWHRSTRARAGALRALTNRLELRGGYLAVGLGLHLGIFALMNVGPFSFASLAYYSTLLHHDEWVSLWHRATGSSSRRGALTRATAKPGP